MANLYDAKVLDSHLHLWKPSLLTYSWLQNENSLNRDFETKDFLTETTPINIEAFEAILIEADVSYQSDLEMLNAENDYFRQICAHTPNFRGAIYHLPLELELPEIDMMLKEYAADPYCLGIRRILQEEEQLDLLFSPRFIDRCKRLARKKLNFDICITHHQMAAVIPLIQQCPDTRFIIDHIAKPNIRLGEISPWANNLELLASFPNVYCKVSGVFTEAERHELKLSTVGPYLDIVFDTFGIDRVLFGSDWPVINKVSSYLDWIDFLRLYLKEYSLEEQEAFFYKNAAYIYRID